MFVALQIPFKLIYKDITECASVKKMIKKNNQ